MSSIARTTDDSARQVTAAEITLSETFRRLAARPSPDEQKQIADALHRHGCREPLVVWRRQNQLILVVGYERIDTLRLYRIPFRVIEKDFASAEEALNYLIGYQLARPNLTALGVSYLRGYRYLMMKQRQGGDRRSAQARRCCVGDTTAEALGEEYHVSTATMRRDAQVTAAVQKIAAGCDLDVQDLFLWRGARLTRGGLLALADLPPAKLQALVKQLYVTGKLPRSWRTDGLPTTITVPLDPQQMARCLLRRLGTRSARALAQALAELLDAQEGPPPGPEAVSGNGRQPLSIQGRMISAAH